MTGVVPNRGTTGVRQATETFEGPPPNSATAGMVNEPTRFRQLGRSAEVRLDAVVPAHVPHVVMSVTHHLPLLQWQQRSGSSHS